VQKIPFIALFHGNPGAIHIHARSPLNQTQQHIHFAMCKSTSFFLSWVLNYYLFRWVEEPAANLQRVHTAGRLWSGFPLRKSGDSND
jgi:hypothetical protein